MSKQTLAVKLFCLQWAHKKRTSIKKNSNIVDRDRKKTAMKVSSRRLKSHLPFTVAENILYIRSRKMASKMGELSILLRTRW